MNIKGVQKNIISALTLTEKVSGRNLTLPVLNCVLLSAHKDTLKLRSTNLDIGVEVSVPISVEQEGEVAVPGNILLSTLSALNPDTSFELLLEGGNLLVKTKTGTSTIKAQPHDDFPTIPKTEGGTSFSVRSSIFVEGVKSVWYSSSISSVKPELASIYIYQYNKKLFFVATDSFRLAEKSVIPQVVLPEFEPILIPTKNVAEIIRALEGADGEVMVCVNENQISFSFGGVYLVSRLTDAQFPDYKQIIPKTKTTEATVLKQDLVDTLKKTSVFSDTFNHISFVLDPKKKQFAITSKNNDIGETKDLVPAALTGEPITISFNHKYLTDVFQAVHTDSLSLSLSGAGKPMVIRGVSDSSFLYLVMPMNR